MKKIFKSEIVEETSYSVASLGNANNEMELVIHKGGSSGCIIWGIEYDDGDEDEVVIGLWFDGNVVQGYDGVFSLPKEAEELLVENGYDISEL